MRIVEASFVVSARGPEDGTGWPESELPEVAFVGRSNVGKSSLLNTLTGQRGLVRVSKTPGRTRLINFFKVRLMDDAKVMRDMMFVDLPGYGYANVSKTERAEWQGFLQTYLSERPALKAMLLLIDSRRDVDIDETELVRWLGGRIRIVPVLTKIDQLPKHARKPAGDKAHAALAAVELEALTADNVEAHKLGRPALVSVKEGDGIDDLLRRIHRAVGPSDKVRP